MFTRIKQLQRSLLCSLALIALCTRSHLLVQGQYYYYCYVRTNTCSSCRITTTVSAVCTRRIFIVVTVTTTITANRFASSDLPQHLQVNMCTRNYLVAMCARNLQIVSDLLAAIYLPIHSYSLLLLLSKCIAVSCRNGTLGFNGRCQANASAFVHIVSGKPVRQAGCYQDSPMRPFLVFAARSVLVTLDCWLVQVLC